MLAPQLLWLESIQKNILKGCGANLTVPRLVKSFMERFKIPESKRDLHVRRQSSILKGYSRYSFMFVRYSMHNVYIYI